jgi:phage shock protein PspC (stress-responsive transcriptional regulator)
MAGPWRAPAHWSQTAKGATVSTEPTREAAFFSTIRSWGIVRSDQRVFGGVLGGVGARIGMAPGPARILFVVIALFTGGLALLGYAAAWALIPDSEGRIIIQDFGRGTPNVGALVAIGVLALLGLFGLDNIGPGNWWGAWANFDSGFFNDNGMMPRLFVLGAMLIPLALVIGIVWIIVWSVRQGRSEEREAQGYARLPDGTIPQAPAPASAAAPVSEAAAEDAIATEVAASMAAPDAATPQATAPLATAPLAAAAAPVYAAAPAAPAYTPPVYSAPTPYYTPKPRVPGPGKFGYLAALALFPLAAAVTLYLSSTDQLGVYPFVAGGVIWVAGLGLILVINALRGRKAGFLGFVSIMALIPVGLSIAAAPELREHYQNDSGWGWNWIDDGEYYGWNWDRTVPSETAEPTYEPEPAFDPSSEFLDYETVAINGTCWEEPELLAPSATGTVRLSAVDADQSITVTSMDTVLAIPEGTSLNIISDGGTDGMAVAHVMWGERGVVCELTSVATPAVQLTNADAPILTVHLDDTLTDGFMTLWIEEN